MNNKTKRKTYLTIMLCLFSFNLFLLNPSISQTSVNSTNNYINKIGNEKPLSSSSQSYNNINWLNNTDFNSGIKPWKNKTIGDVSDLEASYSGRAANYIINGSSGSKEIPDINTPEWKKSKNPDLPIKPDTATIGPSGFYVSHIWDENANQTRNYPSVWWKRTVDMGINMLDYNITSISLNVDFNASVPAVRTSGGDTDLQGAIDRPGDAYQDSMGQGDFAEFYVLIQDVNQENQPTPIAKNNTKDVNLGRDVGPSGPISTIDGSMKVSSESTMRGALQSAFEVNSQKFTIIVGIDLYCEDNEYGADVDNWQDLYIYYFDFAFTYQKIINDGTSLSWYQIGDAINHTTDPYYTSTTINDVSFNFDYSVNNTWPSVADDTRFEIDIDNRSTQFTYPDIKLISYNHSIYKGKFIEARSGGYQLTSFVLPLENISLSIRLVIADEFNYNEKLNISIDNIYFRISYTVFYNPPLPPPPAAENGGKTKTETSIIEEPWFNLLIAIAAIAGATCLTGYIVYYIKVLKYPKPVRKVRKYRRTLKKQKSPDIPILGRKTAFDEKYKGKLGTIASEVKRKPSKSITPSAKSVEKVSEKITPDKIDKLIGKTK